MPEKKNDEPRCDSCSQQTKLRFQPIHRVKRITAIEEAWRSKEETVDDGVYVKESQYLSE
jgi:hypothetical protein